MEKPREEDYTQEIRVSNIFNTKTIELIQDKNILDLGIHQGHLANFAFSLIRLMRCARILKTEILGWFDGVSRPKTN